MALSERWPPSWLSGRASSRLCSIPRYFPCSQKGRTRGFMLSSVTSAAFLQLNPLTAWLGYQNVPFSRFSRFRTPPVSLVAPTPSVLKPAILAVPALAKGLCAPSSQQHGRAWVSLGFFPLLPEPLFLGRPSCVHDSACQLLPHGRLSRSHVCQQSWSVLFT